MKCLIYFVVCFFFFNQKTAYEMRISDWSSDVCSSDLGQGCPLRHEPSISRAAIPASRIRGPSRHQIGPSPSQTLTGVQMNDWPLGTTATASRNTASISAQSGRWRASCFREERQCIRPRGGLVGEDIEAAQTHCQVSRQLRRCTASRNGVEIGRDHV